MGEIEETRSYPEAVVIIPALNEEQAIGKVIDALPPVSRILLVDNGSTDATAQVARDRGAEVHPEPRRGYGSACLRGIDAIGSGGPAPEVVVFLDGDLADDPSRLGSLVDPILADEVDFVIGSRLLGEREPGAMPPHQVFGNKLACFLMRLFFGVRHTDLGPFRAIRYRSLIELEMADPDFGWTVEMQLKAAAVGLRTIEVPVPYRARIGKSKISGTIVGSARAGVKIVLVVLRYVGRIGRAKAPAVGSDRA